MISPKLSLPQVSRQEQSETPPPSNSPPSSPRPLGPLFPGQPQALLSPDQPKTSSQNLKMTNFSIAAIMNSGSGNGPRHPFGSPGGLTGPGSLVAAQKLHQQHLTNLRDQALLQMGSVAARRGLDESALNNSSSFGKNSEISAKLRSNAK